MVWGEKVNEIVDELVSRLKEVSILENRVYKGYQTSLKEFPSVLVHLTSVRSRRETTAFDTFFLSFNIVVRDVNDIQSDAEQEMSDFISTVGKVVDCLYTYLHNPEKWNLLTIEEVNLTFHRDRNMVFHNALITVTIRKGWKVTS